MSLRNFIGLGLVLLLGGVAHGVLTDRWGVPGSVVDAAETVKNLPTTLEGWSSEDIPVTDRIVKIAGAVSIVTRDYKNPLNGDQVRVMLVCGRPGPVTRHPPTVCFPAGGLNQVSEVRSAEFPIVGTEEAAQFSECVFAHKSKGGQARLMTHWGWSTHGKSWQSPSDPRFAFAGEPWLYKLYLVAPEIPAAEASSPQSLSRREFVDALLAELQSLLI
jgi:hypothetical protein